jgi:hypothetical protein
MWGSGQNLSGQKEKDMLRMIVERKRGNAANEASTLRKVSKIR